jgi:hypothetical protein
MFSLRYIRVLPLLGIALLAIAAIAAILIRFGVAELAPTESHTEQVEIGRSVFLPPDWADAWRVCASVGLLGMCLMLVTPLLRYLPDDE